MNGNRESGIGNVEKPSDLGLSPTSQSASTDLSEGATKAALASTIPHSPLLQHKDVPMPRAQDAQERPPGRIAQVPRAQDAQALGAILHLGLFILT